MEDLIYKQLKECDTVTDYMTKEEAVEYYKREYPNDYQSLVKLYGDNQKGQ